MRPNPFITAISGTDAMPSLSTQDSPSRLHPDTQLAEAALESTRMAIARWTGGIHLPQMLVPGMVRVSPQARWYAQVNNGFQEWLSQGGFDQTTDAAQRDKDWANGALRRSLDNENVDSCCE